MAVGASERERLTIDSDGGAKTGKHKAQLWIKQNKLEAKFAVEGSRLYANTSICSKNEECWLNQTLWLQWADLTMQPPRKYCKSRAIYF